MPAKKQNPSGSPGAWIHSTRLHLLLYASLLVATPFVMLQSFLQEAIGAISRFHVDLAGLEIPIVPGAVLLLGLLCLLLLRSRLTRRRIMAAPSLRHLGVGAQHDLQRARGVAWDTGGHPRASEFARPADLYRNLDHLEVLED